MKQSEIETLLPEVFQRTIRPESPLSAILEVMEILHAPSEEILDHLDEYFDPYRTPDRFVPYLARWVDLERFLGDFPEELSAASPPSFPSGLGRLRELIMTAAFLSKWRGTTKGLLHFLETATGAKGFEIHERVPDIEGRRRPFHILVRAPKSTKPYRELIEQIVETENPAYVTYDLEFT